MATGGYKVQIPLRNKGQTTCIHHKWEQLDFYCKECKDLVCIRCSSTVHNSHPLCGLSEITHQKKEDITHFIEQTENVDFVQIDQYIAECDTQLKENASNFEKLSHKMRTKTNKLKQSLDLSKGLSLYKQMLDDNTRLLRSYKQDLEMYNTQLKKQVEECKKVLQCASDIKIYDTAAEIRSPLILPTKPTLRTASFTPNNSSQGDLKETIGKANTSSQGQGTVLQGQGQSVVLPPGQRPSATEKKFKLKAKILFTKQMSHETETTELEEWRSPCVIDYICPTTDGQIWTSDGDNYDLTLFDRKGDVKQKIGHDIGISSISLSPTTNTLWICDWDKNITELVSGRLVHRFSTKESPQSICITTSNHVIVGMTKQISKFTTNGKLVLTAYTEEKKEASACAPVCISECPVTLNVAVVDKYHGGKGKHNVVVMDRYFNKIFVYDGEDPHIQSGGKPFDPCSVVYDSVGNLVIGDYDNNCVLLINGRGDFLGIIHRDKNNTWTVGIDRMDVLWAVFGGDNVKLLKYKKKCVVRNHDNERKQDITVPRTTC